MILGVGDVQDVSVQRHPLRTEERGVRKICVDAARRALANDGRSPRLMMTLQPA
jgi:hypothetical protein